MTYYYKIGPSEKSGDEEEEKKYRKTDRQKYEGKSAICNAVNEWRTDRFIKELHSKNRIKIQSAIKLDLNCFLSLFNDDYFRK